MMPLITAFLEAFTAACNAYVEHAKWTRETEKQKTLDALQDEKLRLAESGTPADKLRLQIIQSHYDRVAGS